MIIATPQPTHASVGNAPIIVGVIGSSGLAWPRLFTGKGTPNTQLLQGNGKYNGTASGWIVAATIAAGGAAYSPGDVLTENAGGTGTAMQITVDQVDPNGLIIDSHTSLTGNYTAYPNPAGAAFSGGTGNGAQFNLIVPAPDYYVDYTTLTAPAFYLCMTAGSAANSVWAQISGGGGGWVLYDPTVDYAQGAIVYKPNGTLPGLYGVNLVGLVGSQAKTSQNPISALTLPIPATSPWILFAPGLQNLGACGANGQTSVWINAAGTLS